LENLRGSVSCEHDELGDTAVEGLGRLVGTLLQLPVVGSLLDEVENLLAESGVGLGPCCAVVVGHCERGVVGWFGKGGGRFTAESSPGRMGSLLLLAGEYCSRW
jgi:hypothetical protein